MPFFKKSASKGPPSDTNSTTTKVDSAAPTEKPSLEKGSAQDDPPSAKDGTLPAGGADAFDETVNHLKGTKLAALIVALCLCVFLVALDQTIIAPALGAITAEFQSVKDIVSMALFLFFFFFFPQRPYCLVSAANV